MVTFLNSLRLTSLLEGGDAAGTACLSLSKVFDKSIPGRFAQQDKEGLTELRADGAGLFKTVCVCGGVSLILEMMMTVIPRWGRFNPLQDVPTGGCQGCFQLNPC